MSFFKIKAMASALRWVLGFGVVGALVACSPSWWRPAQAEVVTQRLAQGQGLSASTPLAEWPPEAVQRALGLRLFFDVGLSADGRVSCGTCHDPKRFFTDGRALSVGVGGKQGTRSAPTVAGLGRAPLLFWDGRAAGLEAQAAGPIENPVEMNLPLAEALAKVKAKAPYPAWFQAAFGRAPTVPDLLAALAAFERAIAFEPSAYERWQYGDDAAMSPAQVRGQAVFGRNQCGKCHKGLELTDQAFHNTGWGLDQPKPDPGRFAVTQQPEDFGSFKTPTLRNVGQTAPYMHDGRLKTLREVVDFYDRGGHPNPNLDPFMQELRLSEQEKEDLVAFMGALDAKTNFPALADEAAALGRAPRGR